MKQYKFEVRTYEDGVRFKSKLVRTEKLRCENFLDAYKVFFARIANKELGLPYSNISKYPDGSFRALVNYNYKVSVFILEKRLLLDGNYEDFWTNVAEILV